MEDSCKTSQMKRVDNSEFRMCNLSGSVLVKWRNERAVLVECSLSWDLRRRRGASVRRRGVRFTSWADGLWRSNITKRSDILTFSTSVTRFEVFKPSAKQNFYKMRGHPDDQG
uniref:Uncharacterized protein n=1 Tax=Ascaris lumbricoides TaxID=6252 RepID=A0A0M3HSK2_ASCLU